MFTGLQLDRKHFLCLQEERIYFAASTRTVSPARLRISTSAFHRFRSGDDVVFSVGLQQRKAMASVAPSLTPAAFPQNLGEVPDSVQSACPSARCLELRTGRLQLHPFCPQWQREAAETQQPSSLAAETAFLSSGEEWQTSGESVLLLSQGETLLLCSTLGVRQQRVIGVSR
jgi:hypothetical protein